MTKTGTIRRRDAAPRPHRPQPRPAATRPRRWLPLLMLPVWLGLIGVGLWLHRIPLWALGAVAALNVVTLLVYAVDKSAAESGRWRTAESTLHGLALLGGWPAAWLAQIALRHKSSKAPFLQTYALTVVLHCAALAGWIFWLAPGLVVRSA